MLTIKHVAQKVVTSLLVVIFTASMHVHAKTIEHKQDAKDYAKTYMQDKYGWSGSQFTCTEKIFEYESHWNYKDKNGKYLGIPQVNAGFVKGQGYSKAEFMKDYKLQVRVGLTYIKKRYGTPCTAWGHIQDTRWY